jgi:hypothetical protein
MAQRREAAMDLFQLAGTALTRRAFGALVLGAVPLVRRRTALVGDQIDFEPVPASRADSVVVPRGFVCDVVLAWGDPLTPDAPPFTPDTLTGAEQARRFGFNCDFNAWFPLPGGASDEGLLCTNHESTQVEQMFRAVRDDDERHRVELEAHGLSIVHLVRPAGGRWRRASDSQRHRRVSGTTPMAFSGPAAGSAYLVTRADPEGRRVIGTFGNCAGGRTPWGTVLSCEENVHEYFSNRERAPDGEVRTALARYGFIEGDGVYTFARHDPRFDLAHEPNEANRFGWVVEIDPFDAQALPIKHTALGRMKHESATVGSARDGRVVVYTGDDEANEYLYKFVSTHAFDPARPNERRGLLEDGVLHVARFSSNGEGEWVPLVPEGRLANWSRARIAVHTRQAADLVGATPLDRPEDVAIAPHDGRVFVCLTKNSKRASGDGGPNPRAKNKSGQVVEICERGGDHGALRFTWTLFIVGGDDVDPARAEAGGRGPAAKHLSCPDNLACDARGNLWITTDGQPDVTGENDALWAAATIGPERAVPRRFLTGPIGAEVTGPEFTPDGRTLFLSIQHPGADGGLEKPTSRWPHDSLDRPRPSVVAIEREDGAPFA